VLGGGFAGVYTLANALAAAGSRQAVANALEQFARCVRAGGRLFIQILNFQPMRREEPCVRGPRVVTVDGLEYVSARHFHFFNDVVRVSNVTLWKQREWRMRTQGGVLYPIEHDELTARLAKAGFAVDALYGGYGREPFDPAASVDLIVVATRNAAL
jgi:hypothetical protein